MIRMATLITLLLASMLALADIPIDERAPMRSGGELEVSNVAGLIEITGWERDEVQVEGTLWKGAKRLVFDPQGDRTVIEVELPRNVRNTRGSRLEIKVPFATDVIAMAVSADVFINGVQGDKHLQSVSGDLRGEFNGDSVELRTVSGDIEGSGKNATGDTRVAAVSGDVTLSAMAGELHIETVSGDISAGESTISRLDLEAVSGDADLQLNLLSGGRLDAHTVSGDVVINLDNGADMELMLESFSGDIGSLFGHSAERTSRHGPGRELRLQAGAGTTPVRVETLSGDITVRTFAEPAGPVRNLNARRGRGGND